MQILTSNHWTEVGDPNGELVEGLKELKGEDEPIGRPVVSTKLDPWELPKTEPQTRQ